MIKQNGDIWRLFVIIGAVLLILIIPLMTAQAASPPLVVRAAAFPTPSEIWAIIEPRLIVLLILTIFDFLFGVILAVVSREFKWDYLMHYLNTDILPILVWMAVVVISQIPDEFIPAGALPVFEYGIYATVFLSITASLFGHFKKIGVLASARNPDGQA
jgi:hypothetical protein